MAQTPKEKAKELFSKYFSEFEFSESTNEVDSAKQCALITVNEILVIMNEEYLSGAYKIEYWQQVKNEIELL